MNQVIAVSGPPGSGKTSLLAALANQLDDTCLVFFDHYEQITQLPLEQVLDWSRRGGDVNEFVIAGLGEAVRRLKAGGSVVDPTTGQALGPARHILFETPFGRAHRDTGGCIDVLVWIDVPLDIALARNLRELLRRAERTEPPVPAAEELRWIEAYLDGYLQGVGGLLEKQREQIGRDADLTVDGRQTIASLVREVSAVIARRDSAAHARR